MQYLVRHWPEEKAWRLTEENSDNVPAVVEKHTIENWMPETGEFKMTDEYSVYLPYVFDEISDIAFALQKAEYYIIKAIKEEI